MSLNTTSRRLERVPTGISGLDTILKGGFYRGGLYLVRGTPGTGKTTLANQICFNHVARGERALYSTLLSEYHSRFGQYLGKMSFFDASKIPDHMEYISAFGVMRKEGIAGLLTLCRRELIARKASMLVLDGLVAAQRMTNNDQSFNEFIHELQGLAIAANCTVLLITSSDPDMKTTPEHTMVDGIIGMIDESFGAYSERTLEVAKIRGTDYLRGKHAYKITDDGISVYPRIEALLEYPSVSDRTTTDRMTAGIGQLDAMLHGGLPVSSPTMVMGPSGTGKTTFGLHFLAASTAEQPGLMFGFYETMPRIVAKAQQVCPRLLPLMENHLVEMVWLPPVHDSLDMYGERLLKAVKERGVRRLFVDGFGALLNVPNAQQRIGQFVPALSNELRVLGVTTIHTVEAHSSAGPNARTRFGDPSLMAENMILLRYVELDARLHRLISVTKVRDSDFDHDVHEYVLTDQGPVIDASYERARAIMKASGQQKSTDEPAPPRGD